MRNEASRSRASAGNADQATLAPGEIPGRFRLEGDVGFVNARRLWEQGEVTLGGQQRMEIDLSAVSRADSAGVALLLAWTRQARRDGATIRFVNIPAQMRAIAAACGVESILPFQAAGDDATDNSESSQA